MERIRRPKVIDCFAGAGGFALGLSQAGFEIALAFDADPSAIKTYKRNLGAHAEVLKAEEVSGDYILRAAGIKADDLAIVVGGPPCQGFSRQRRGDDQDTRNDLVLEFIRLVIEISPVAFVMENVPAIRSKRGRRIFDEVRRRASAAGYHLDDAVLDAADFGVPQHRKRLFLVGIQEEVGRFEFPLATHSREDFVTVADAIADLPSPTSESRGAIPNHEPDNISDLNRRRISHVPEGGGRADIPAELQLPCHAVSVERAGHRGVYGRLAWNRPAGTITTKCNSFTRGRFAHPVENRNISMREAARLQSFPDAFIFDGDKVSVAHQIGNAVPPRLALKLGEALMAALAGTERRHSSDQTVQMTLSL